MPSYMKSPSSACPGGACEGCSDPMCMSKGGEVKGVHRSRDDVDEIDYGRPGESVAGSEMRTNYTPATKYRLQPEDKSQNKETLGKVKDEHYKVLGQMTAMKGKNREYLAEGGEVEGPEVEDEIHGMLGEELMSAFESKDRKRVMEGLEALVMSCMNKRGEPDA